MAITRGRFTRPFAGQALQTRVSMPNGTCRRYFLIQIASWSRNVAQPRQTKIRGCRCVDSEPRMPSADTSGKLGVSSCSPIERTSRIAFPGMRFFPNRRGSTCVVPTSANQRGPRFISPTPPQRRAPVADPRESSQTRRAGVSAPARHKPRHGRCG